MSDLLLPEHITATGRELIRLGSAMCLNPQNTAETLGLAEAELTALIAIALKRTFNPPAIVTDIRYAPRESSDYHDSAGNLAGIAFFGSEEMQITIRKF